MSLLDSTLAAISPVGEDASNAALARLNSLTKPLGSLGRLEEIVRRYAAIRRDPAARWGGGTIAVFVADHGVADEGVSAYPKAVTIQMLRNIAQGGAAISVLARHFGLGLEVINVGVETDTSAEPMPGVRYRRIGAGTRNFLREPAMSAADARRAIEAGIEVARDAAQSGVTILGIGEMGIANSTSAAAILSATTGVSPERIAGRGTGLDDARLRHKVEVIRSCARASPWRASRSARAARRARRFRDRRDGWRVHRRRGSSRADRGRRIHRDRGGGSSR